MSEQEKMRRDVKLLKATDAITSYKELVELMDNISLKGFYNWLAGSYDLGAEKSKQLRELIDTLSIPD